jgi:hypothetical protein
VEPERVRPFGSFENTLSASAVQSPDSAQSFTRRLSGASYVCATRRDNRSSDAKFRVHSVPR